MLSELMCNLTRDIDDVAIRIPGGVNGVDQHPGSATRGSVRRGHLVPRPGDEVLVRQPDRRRREAKEPYEVHNSHLSVGPTRSFRAISNETFVSNVSPQRCIIGQNFGLFSILEIGLCM